MILLLGVTKTYDEAEGGGNTLKRGFREFQWRLSDLIKTGGASHLTDNESPVQSAFAVSSGKDCAVKDRIKFNT